MKLCLPVLLVALVATVLCSIDYAAANTVCPQENCMDSSNCDELLVGAGCPRFGDACCSVVKAGFRTHCRHYGGECMDSCNPSIQHAVVDCPADKVCCTLL